MKPSSALSTLSSSLKIEQQPLLEKSNKLTTSDYEEKSALKKGKLKGDRDKTLINVEQSTPQKEKEKSLANDKAGKIVPKKSKENVDHYGICIDAKQSTSESSVTAMDSSVEMLQTAIEHEKEESSLSTFSISTNLKKHDKQCKWHNRKRRRNVIRSKFRKHDNQKKDEHEFLELLEKYKHQKFILDCVCKRTRWSWLRDLWGIIINVFRVIRQIIWCCCCPPILGFCLNKVAFWPPQREYYFFIEKTAQNTADEHETLARHHIVVRKANKDCLQRKDLRFGFEHECATEICGIECFVTRTEMKNHIACVFVRNSKPRYTLLFSHPNGSDISDHLMGLPNLHDAARFFNCNVCTYDYSGYGISEGSPNEKNLYFDINAVYKYLLEDLCIPEANIILWGYSIGTVASVVLASQATKLAGLILLAPVASIIRTLCWRKCCWEQSDRCDRLADCCSDRFNIIKKIGDIKMPTLIAHGVQDMIVSVENGRALYRLCPGAVTPLWIPDVGHNNLENSALLWRRIRKFINREARPPLSRRKHKLSNQHCKKHGRHKENSRNEKKKSHRKIQID